jgi:hypothetical protein
MAANGPSEQLRLGFLTAIEVPERGFVGGLLVTNQGGRPLEFQCTVPVKPNTTQRILYGPTLESFMLGELIGAALVAKAGVKPQVILTDRAPILELRNHVDQPVAFVARPGDEPAEHADRTISAPMKFGRQWLHFHQSHEADQAAITRQGTSLPADADLQEPFDRIREALQETLRGGALR